MIDTTSLVTATQITIITAHGGTAQPGDLELAQQIIAAITPKFTQAILTDAADHLQLPGRATYYGSNQWDAYQAAEADARQWLRQQASGS